MLKEQHGAHKHFYSLLVGREGVLEFLRYETGGNDLHTKLCMKQQSVMAEDTTSGSRAPAPCSTTCNLHNIGLRFSIYKMKLIILFVS